MPERTLSESLADWFSHWDWTDDVDEEEGQAVVKEVAALEAENERLRANMHEAEENWLESIQSLEGENEWLRKVVNVTRSYLYDNNATQGAIFDALEELDRLGITRDA